jgi:hypothetical protein
MNLDETAVTYAFLELLAMCCAKKNGLKERGLRKKGLERQTCEAL